MWNDFHEHYGNNVYFQNLNYRYHGYKENEEKMKSRMENREDNNKIEKKLPKNRFPSYDEGECSEVNNQYTELWTEQLEIKKNPVI